MNKKDYVASVFKTFDLDLSTLPSRIAFQKTVYLLQQLRGVSTFNFNWHNFGPYSSELASIGFSINDAEILNAQILNGKEVSDFLTLKQGYEKDSKFLELMSDIVFLVKNRQIKSKDDLFTEIVNHRSYLNDKIVFDLAIKRLSAFNLI